MYLWSALNMFHSNKKELNVAKNVSVKEYVQENTDNMSDPEPVSPAEGVGSYIRRRMWFDTFKENIVLYNLCVNMNMYACFDHDRHKHN